MLWFHPDRSRRTERLPGLRHPVALEVELLATAVEVPSAAVVPLAVAAAMVEAVAVAAVVPLAEAAAVVEAPSVAAVLLEAVAVAAVPVAGVAAEGVEAADRKTQLRKRNCAELFASAQFCLWNGQDSLGSQRLSNP